MNKISHGKVRDIYEVDNDKLLIVVSDRISAFDFIMPNPVPDKGILLNKISEFWFNFVQDIIPNHIISTDIKDYPVEFQKEEFIGRSMLVKKLKMLPVECIVRGYITGSGWENYLKDSTVCGIKLPEGLLESQKLEEPLFTPSTKAALGDHDENISFEQACNLLGTELATKVKNATIDIYKKCAEYAYTKGIIIADTKFEFGLDENGNLILADEVLTPDSSRFWSLENYVVGKGQDSFDKQYLRNWLKDNGYRNAPPSELPQNVIDNTRDKYVKAYKIITEKSFK